MNAVPQSLLNRLATGQPQDVIVEFDSAGVDAEATSMRLQKKIPHDDRDIIEYKAQRFGQIKAGVLSLLPAAEVGVLADYSHLPMMFLRLRSPSALARLTDLSQVVAIYENRAIYLYLAQSLPLINQPQAASAGTEGAGTTVAVLDTGVNYTLSDFGSCTGPGAPSTCKVAACIDVTPYPNPPLNSCPDTIGHGTNVSAIVVGVAPDSRVAAVKVFDSNGSATDAQVIAGINWAIANKSACNIVAINMSLGDGNDYTSPCSDRHTNPYVTPVSNARSAGILPVAASGNNAYTNGIGSPACTPGVISVGAVYDSNIGGVGYGVCTDSTTAADQITCFSNSASFLTMLAPGAAITAGGSTLYGTSQATPHVAGAVAVLRAGFPSETLDATTTRLTSTGRPITDPRNSVTKPRVDVYAALELAPPPVAVPALSIYGLWGVVAALSFLGVAAIRKRPNGS